MAARAKKRAAYGLLALVAVKVASSAPSQGAETVSLLAAARTDGSARYLPRQKGQLHLGRAQIVNLHGCETRLRTTPMHRVFRRHPRVALQPRRAVPGGSWAPRPGRMQGPELPLTDEHAWQSSPLPFPETAEDPLRSKCGTRLLRAGHIGARN